MKRSKLIKSALASCLAAGLQVNLQGANYNWVGGDGDFGNSIHWSPAGGPPGAGDTGTISAAANIDVSFSSDFLGANSPAAINLGNHVIFDTFAHQFNVDGPFTFTGSDSLLTVRPVLADPTKFGFESNQLNINGGNTMRILGGKAKTTTFSLGEGTIWLDGGATLQGSNSLSFIGNSSGSDDARLNVFNGGVSTIDGQVQFNHDAFVDVFSNTTLRLARNVTLNGGGTFQGSGTLQFDGAETFVISDTDIEMSAGRVDLDGGGGVLSAGQKWIVQGALNIHAEGIDIDDNVFGNHNLIGEDTIEIRHMGTLNIQLTDPKLAWTMAGLLDINAPDASFGTDTSIAGSAIIMTGTTDVSGSSQWTARADLVGDTTVQANADLHLIGGTLGVPNTLQGGSITGAGKLATTAAHGLVGHGTIGTKLAFASLSQLMADDGTLTLTPNAQLLQLGTIGTRNSTGILDVQFDWNTATAAQSLELRGGTVTGGVITNGGETRGHGQITAAGFINRGALIPQLATLTIDTTNNPDLDGAFNGISGAGTIDASAGSLIVKPALTDGFNSTITIGPSQFVTFEHGWTLDRGSAFSGFGVLNLNGGANVANRAKISGGPQVLNGIVNVDLEAEFAYVL